MNRGTDFSTTDDDTNILTFEESAATDLGEAIFLPANDEFDEQVAQAQEQLEELRRQQEEIERQKNELEHLRIRQAEFQRGRVEMIENLQHALDVLDRDAFDAEQRVEQYARAKECFTKHLDGIANLRPESWFREELKGELEGATNQIDEARDEYRRTLEHLDELAPDHLALPQITPSHPSPVPVDAEMADQPATDFTPLLAADGRSFGYWFRSGFAFTMPLMVFGFFALMLVLLFG